MKGIIQNVLRNVQPLIYKTCFMTFVPITDMQSIEQFHHLASGLVNFEFTYK